MQESTSFNLVFIADMEEMRPIVMDPEIGIINNAKGLGAISQKVTNNFSYERKAACP